MADDPKKKKKPAAAQSGEASLAAPPSAPHADSQLTDEEYAAKLQGALQKPADGTTAQPAPESPVKGWWDKFNAVMSKQRDPSEVVRGAARGVVNAAVSGVQTAGEVALSMATSGTMPKNAKHFGEQIGGAGTKAEEAVLGKRPDDGLAAFTESATQFISGFAATNAVLPGSGVLAGLAKGAITDFSFFEPYEAQLAELAARTKIPGLSHLGELLSVKEDDAPIVARLKRATAGAIPGAVLDGIVAGARSIRAGKVLAKGATGAEKKAAEEALEINAKVVQDVSEGTHVADGSHTKVIENGDGTYSVHPREEAGDLGVTPPRFEDKAEALQQAESMDSAIQDKLDAGNTAFDPEAIHDMIRSDMPPEFFIKASAHNTVEQDLELVKKLSESIIEKRSALEATTGGSITIEEGKRLAKETLEKIPEGELHDTIKGLLKANPESQDIVSVMADMVLGVKGRNIVKLHDVIEARPHDPVAMEQLQTAIANYFDLRDATHAGESAGARRLRFVQERGTMRQEEFRTATDVANAPAVKEVKETLEDLEKFINRTDTVDISASDFSYARQRKRLEAAYNKIQKGSIDFEHDPEATLEHSADIKGAADEQRATPEELQKLSKEEQDALKNTKTTTTNPIEELSRWMDNADIGVGRDMDKARGLIEKAKKYVDEFAKADPVGDFKKGAAAADEKFTGMPNTAAGMKLRKADVLTLNEQNTKVIARMFKMAGGAPTDVDAVIRGATVTQHGGTGKAALEVFTNSLLSGPPTWATVTISGAAISHMEPFVKMVAGAATANKAMVREGVDTMFGLYSHFTDNVKIAAMAMRNGQSIINPAPTTFAIGGLTGKIVRTPGNIMMGLDEFTRVSNYRAYVRAKSLRAGREAGLEGAGLAQRVDQDLRAAFDPQTGIATIPQALKYADVATLSSGLQPGFGRALQDFTNDALMAKFVMPFVRASSNIFTYVHQSTPLLNLANKQAREAIMRGGEEAAVYHARSALAATLGGVAYTMAVQGKLTGKGPADPELRKAWLKDHQPYSVRVGNKWISYNRMDPLATPLGLIADWQVFQQELGTEHLDVENTSYAILGSIASNLANKTYLRGAIDFSEAWSKGDPRAVGRYLQGQTSSLVVPNLVNKVNPDPYYREVDGMMDAIKSRMPYFSETLDARYDLFGEKILKAEGLANRALNPFTVKDATPSKVEEELLTIGKSLAPAPEKLEGGMIDLHDKKYVEKEGQPSPYTRMMELIRNPGHNLPSLREAMEKHIKSPGWDKLSDGTEDFKGGRKLAILAGEKERYESMAMRKVLMEYPKLNTQLMAIRRARGAAMLGGEDAQGQSEILTGPIR